MAQCRERFSLADIPQLHHPIKRASRNHAAIWAHSDFGDAVSVLRHDTHTGATLDIPQPHTAIAAGPRNQKVAIGVPCNCVYFTLVARKCTKVVAVLVTPAVLAISPTTCHHLGFVGPTVRSEHGVLNRYTKCKFHSKSACATDC